MKMYVPILQKIMKKYNFIKYSSKKHDYNNSDNDNDNKIYAFLTRKKMIDNMKINILLAKADIDKFEGKRYNFDDIIKRSSSASSSSAKREKPEGFMTCDEKIYYNIIPKKEKLIKKIEVILKKSAVDYYLYNCIHLF